MNNHLARLTEILPLPPAPPAGKDWDAVESALGTTLPTDYKEFISVYGGGLVDGYLTVLEPSCVHPGYDLIRIVARRTEANEELWQYTDRPPELEEPGSRLIAWGATDNAEYLFWLARPGQAPDNWATMINDGGGEYWETHSMTCTEFLAATLTGQTRSGILSGYHYPRPTHTFRPAQPPLPH
ncbi:SMI1/KNR4 family protein [Streptomyces sp. NPDC094448]|uniref:SMI1/KNR4 family protein n=1 Tax=Streptomyces sp. NPDC094448 TaxID=3366063 RepID=UPI0037F3E7AA